MNEKLIIEDYESGMEAKEVIEKHQIGNTTLYRILKRNDIKRKSEKNQLNFKKVFKLYDKGMTLKDIGDRFNCSKSKVKTVLVKNGVVLRTRGESQRHCNDKEMIIDYKSGLDTRDIVKKYKCGSIYRVLKRNNVDFRHNLNDWQIEEILKKYQELKNITEVARKLNYSTMTVWKWLHNNNVEIYENKKIGEEHWSWKGGVSTEAEKIRTSPEYNLWRKKVYARDGFRCLFPGCTSQSRKIQAHHILPVYYDIDLILDLNNGITLCRRCHETIVNGNEMDFVEIFSDIIDGKILDEKKFKKYLEKRVDDEPRLCACGCGKYTKVFRGKAQKYFVGHSKSKLDLEKLKKLYTVDKKSTKEIAEELGFCQSYINLNIRHLIEFGDIEKRKLLKFKKLNLDLDLIKKLYLEDMLSVSKVAKELGVSSTLIGNKVRELGIQRSQSEAQKNRFSK